MAIIFTNTITVQCSKDKLWRHVADVERWPEFLPTFSEVEMLDPSLTPGGQVRIRQPLQPSQIWTVRVFEPGELHWFARVGGLELHARHQITERPDGAAQLLELELRGRGARVAGFFLGWLFQFALWLENRGFQAEALKVPETEV